MNSEDNTSSLYQKIALRQDGLSISELADTFNLTEEEVLKDVHSERDKLFIRIRFLFVQFGFNPNSLKKKGLLAKDYEIPVREKGTLSWVRHIRNRTDAQDKNVNKGKIHSSSKDIHLPS